MTYQELPAGSCPQHSKMVACARRSDRLRAQPELPSALKTDTPRSICPKRAPTHAKNPFFVRYFSTGAWSFRDRLFVGAAYRKAISLKPAFAEAYQGLDIALLGQQKPAAGEAAFRKVLDRKTGLGLDG
jgi:hypothetical protein